MSLLFYCNENNENTKKRRLLDDFDSRHLKRTRLLPLLLHFKRLQYGSHIIIMCLDLCVYICTGLYSTLNKVTIFETNKVKFPEELLKVSEIRVLFSLQGLTFILLWVEERRGGREGIRQSLTVKFELERLLRTDLSYKNANNFYNKYL